VHVVLNLLGLEAAAQVIGVIDVQLDLAVGSLVLVSDLLVVLLVIIFVIVFCWVTVHLVASHDVINNLARLSIVAIFKRVVAAPWLLAILITIVLVHVFIIIRILHIDHLVPILDDIVVFVRGHRILHFVAHLDIQMLSSNFLKFKIILLPT